MKKKKAKGLYGRVMAQAREAVIQNRPIEIKQRKQIKKILTHYNIKMSAYKTVEAAIDNAFLAHRREVIKNQKIASLEILKGRFMCSQTQRWSNKSITPHQISQIRDWMWSLCRFTSINKSSIQSCSAILEAMEGILCSELKESSGRRRIKRLPTYLALSLSGLDMSQKVFGSSTIRAHAILKALLPYVLNPQPIKCGGYDDKFRAAKATSEIMGIYGKTISPNTILRANLNDKPSLRR